MKRVAAALGILAVIVAVSAFHVYKVTSLCGDVGETIGSIYDAYADDRWEEIDAQMEKLSTRWEKDKMWARLTIPTSQIDEIEISLDQSTEYSKLRAKPDFIGEFVMFCKLIDHLPKQETFYIEELL